jgi:hypothetical protein
MIYLLIAFYYTIILTSLITRKSKLLFLAIIVLSIVFGLNISNPDYNSYYIFYNFIETIEDPEIGFKSLILLSNYFGLTYQQFRFLIGFLGLTIIFIATTRLFGKRVLPYVLMFYLVYPFMLDVTQIRNFLMYSFVFLAFSFLVGDNKYKNIYFIFIILISSSIHIVGLIYFPVILVYSKINRFSRNDFIFPIYIFIILIASLSGLFEFSANLILNSFNFDSTRVIANLQVYTRYGYLIYCFFQAGIFLIIRSLYLQKKNTYKKDGNFHRLIYSLNAYLLLLMPLYIYNITYFRFFRNIIILNIAFIIHIVISQKKSIFSFRVFIFVMLIFILLLFDLYAPYWRDIVIPFLH